MTRITRQDKAEKKEERDEREMREAKEDLALLMDMRKRLKRPKALDAQAFAARLAKAKAVAKKHSVDAVDDPAMAILYTNSPAWAFYRFDGAPARVVGACGDGKCLHIAALDDANKPFSKANVPPEKMEQVAKWSKQDLKRIRSSTLPGFFLDPCGFICISSIDEDVVAEERKLLGRGMLEAIAHEILDPDKQSDALQMQASIANLMKDLDLHQPSNML